MSIGTNWAAFELIMKQKQPGAIRDGFCCRQAPAKEHNRNFVFYIPAPEVCTETDELSSVMLLDS